MGHPQSVLFLDTAMAGVCVAVAHQDGRSSHRAEPMVRGQAERLMPLAQEVLQEADLSFDDIEAIVTTIGPGAFTGLRIGLSAAKALALSLDIPVFGITSLQALAFMAAQENEGQDIAVLLETKRKDYYFQRFDDKAQAVLEPQALSGGEIVQQLQGCLIVGDAIERFEAEQDTFENTKPYHLVKPDVIAQAFTQHGPGHFLFSEATDPLYLRGADVSQPKSKPRVLASQ